MASPAVKMLMAGGGSAPFSPSSITGLWAWFDASNAGSITASSGAVSQWSDLSGSGRHVTQSTGAAKPTTGTRTLNGLNVLDFDGGDWLARTAAIGFGIGTSTIFIVAGSDADSSSFFRFMSFHNGSGNDYDNVNSMAITQGDTTRWFWAFLNGIGCTYGAFASATPIGTWALRKGTAGSQFNVIAPDGGTTAVTETSNGTANGGFVIGGGYESGVAGTNPFNGPIGEILVYSAYLSDADRTTVRNYLIAKWGA